MIVYYINVPLNEKGVIEFEQNDDNMPNVKSYNLTEDEYIALRKKGGLFDKFDDSFGTIIDICEEERINLEDIPKAIMIVEKYKQKTRDSITLEGAYKILESLNVALQSKTFWEIDIFLV